MGAPTETKDPEDCKTKIAKDRLGYSVVADFQEDD
jgi:hypothetical protein